MARASVDLPQPDSPTMPSVSPGLQVEGHAVDGLQRGDGVHGQALRSRTLKCTLRSRTDSSGSSLRHRRPPSHRARPPSGGRRAASATSGDKRCSSGIVDDAALLHVAAARRERAARRRSAFMLGGLPGMLDQRAAPVSSRGSAASRPRVYGCDGRWNRSSADALFHHAAAVHHHHLVAQAGNHAQVVRDHHDGRAVVALQLAQQLK